MNENETREEERRRIATEGGSTYAHRTTTVKKRIFSSSSSSLSLCEIFSTKRKKKERMPNSISILFHFFNFCLYS
jgi:hypothetical protein